MKREVMVVPGKMAEIEESDLNAGVVTAIERLYDAGRRLAGRGSLRPVRVSLERPVVLRGIPSREQQSRPRTRRHGVVEAVLDRGGWYPVLWLAAGPKGQDVGLVPFLLSHARTTSAEAALSVVDHVGSGVSPQDLAIFVSLMRELGRDEEIAVEGVLPCHPTQNVATVREAWVYETYTGEFIGGGKDYGRVIRVTCPICDEELWERRDDHVGTRAAG